MSQICINTNRKSSVFSHISEKDFSDKGSVTLYPFYLEENRIDKTKEYTFNFDSDKYNSECKVATDCFCEQPTFLEREGVYYPLGSDTFGYYISNINNNTENRYKDLSNVIKLSEVDDENAILEGIPFSYEGIIPCNKYSCNLLKFNEGKTDWISNWHNYTNGVTNDDLSSNIVVSKNIYNAVDGLYINNITKDTYFKYTIKLDANQDYTFSCFMKANTSSKLVLMLYSSSSEYQGQGSDKKIKEFIIYDDWFRYYHTFSVSESGSYNLVLATNVYNENSEDNFSFKICGLSLTESSFPMSYNPYYQNYDNKGISRTSSKSMPVPGDNYAVYNDEYLYYEDQCILCNNWVYPNKEDLGYPAIFKIKNDSIDFTEGFAIVYKRRIPNSCTGVYDYIGSHGITYIKNDSSEEDYYTEIVVLNVLLTNNAYYVKQYSSLNNKELSYTLDENINSLYLYLGYNPVDKQYSNCSTYSDLIIYKGVLSSDEIKSIFNKTLSFFTVGSKVVLKHPCMRESNNACNNNEEIKKWLI